MEKGKSKSDHQEGGISDKKDMNAGSSAFNEGAAQDPDMNDGVADGTPNPEKVSKEKENPKVGNIGKNNAGGYK